VTQGAPCVRGEPCARRIPCGPPGDSMCAKSTTPSFSQPRDFICNGLGRL
jgi:hypothetical protein